MFLKIYKPGYVSRTLTMKLFFTLHSYQLVCIIHSYFIGLNSNKIILKRKKDCMSVIWHINSFTQPESQRKYIKTASAYLYCHGLFI